MDTVWLSVGWVTTAKKEVHAANVLGRNLGFGFPLFFFPFSVRDTTRFYFIACKEEMGMGERVLFFLFRTG